MKYESELEHIEQFSEEEREEIASFYEKMSKTSDTPETDAKASTHIGFYSCATVPADFARRLERERDGARKDRDEQVKLTMLVDERREGAERESIERLSMCVKYKQERDEARDVALRYRSLYFAQNGIDVNEYQIPWEEAK